MFHRYALGDPKNRSKYSGAPTPEQVLSGFDEPRCPRCGRKLVMKPVRVRVLSRAEFEARYVEMKYLIIEKESELALRSTSPTGIAENVAQGNLS